MNNDNEVEKDPNAGSRLLQLPLEIIHLIFFQLPRIQDMAAISITCRAMYISAGREALWIRYPIVLQVKTIDNWWKEQHKGWKEQHKLRLREWLMRASEKDWATDWMTYPNRSCTMADFFTAACVVYAQMSSTRTFLCIKHPDIGMVCWPHTGDTKNMWQHRIADKQIFYLIPYDYSSQVRFFIPGDATVHCDPLAYAAKRRQQIEKEKEKVVVVPSSKNSSE